MSYRGLCLYQPQRRGLRKSKTEHRQRVRRYRLRNWWRKQVKT